jgi:hypothetical protein
MSHITYSNRCPHTVVRLNTKAPRTTRTLGQLRVATADAHRFAEVNCTFSSVGPVVQGTVGYLLDHIISKVIR